MAPLLLVAALAVAITAGTMSVLPRAKPEIPPPVEKPIEQVIILGPPVIVLRPTLPPSPASKEAERLKKLETELQDKRVQAVRIEQKLDQYLQGEEAKDAGGER